MHPNTPPTTLSRPGNARIRVIATLVLVALAALTLLGPAARADASAPHFGFNDDFFYYHGRAPLAAAVGADTAHIPFYWNEIETQRGVYDWTRADAAIAAVRAAGLRPYLAVQYAPCWARPGTPCPGWGGYPPDPAYDGDWGRFVKAVVKRYPDVLGIEVWNEPNGRLFWHPNPDPVRYARLLKVAYDAVHSVRPDVPVLIAGLAPAINDDPVSGWWAWKPFLSTILANGGARYSDALAMHPYPRYPDYLADVDHQLSSAQTLLNNAGVGDKPRWVSETGVSTTAAGIDEAAQAARLTAIYNLLDQRGIPVIIIHRLIDSGPKDGFGVYRSDRTPKLAASALASLRGVTFP